MTGILRRPWLKALVAASVVVALLFAATGLGLRLPGLSFLGRFPDRSSLDYQPRYVGGYVPLRDSFVNARLGGPGNLLSGGPVTSGRGGVLGSESRPVTVDHPATNDDFASAYTLGSVPVTARTDTSKATREAEEPGGCSPVGGTVWYRYTPSRTATLIADTFGTRFSNALAVFTGTQLSALHTEDCDQNAAGSAQVTFRARAGSTYYFQITGVTGGGALTFNVQPLGTTSQIDVKERGVAEQPLDFGGPAVSGDGRYVAFISESIKLGCPEYEVCIFVKDVVSGNTKLVVVGSYISDIDISADGRYVAFSSPDANLVPNDTNGFFGTFDVFVADRITRRVERASVNSAGEEAHIDPVWNARTPPCGYPSSLSGAMWPSLSADGRYVSFISDADNLDRRASGGCTYQAYVRDRRTGRTELVSVDNRGKPIGGFSRYGRAISGDGRYVVFTPGPGGVVLRDRSRGTTRTIGPGQLPVISQDGRRVAFVRTRGGLRYVYVYDTVRRQLIPASVSSDGAEKGTPSSAVAAPGSSTFPRVSISSEGRFVTFESAAPDLTPHDTNGLADVFVRDLSNRTTVLVSVRSDGSQFETDSFFPSISGNGRVIAFMNDSSRRNTFVHASVVAGRP